MTKKKKKSGEEGFPFPTYEGLDENAIKHMEDICLSLADTFDDLEGMTKKTRLDGLQMDDLTREVRKAFRKKDK